MASELQVSGSGGDLHAACSYSWISPPRALRRRIRAVARSATGVVVHGRLINDDERQALAFLRDMDPVFTLRFQDGSIVQVTLTPTDDRRFALTEYTGPANRRVDYHIDL